MSITIRKTGSAEYGQYMKVLICGPSGSGKTLISSTAPNPLFASAEGGLMSIADRHVNYADIKESAQLLAIKNSLDQEPEVREQLLGFRVDTVIIDTIDEIQHILIQERLKETKQDSLQLKDWGWLGEQMGAIIRGFRNLDAHVVFTCHLKETSDGDSGRVWNKPGLQGAIADQIANFMDLTVLLRANTITVVDGGKAVQKTVRVLQTSPDPMYPWIKDRSGKLPGEIDVNFIDDFSRIHAMIFGAVQEIETPKQASIAAPVVTELPANGNGGHPEPTAVVSDPEPVVEAEPVVEPEPVREPVLVGAPAQAEQAVAVETKHATPEQALPDVPELKCSQCGTEITQDQADLSRIRFRIIACRPCCTELKNKK